MCVNRKITGIDFDGGYAEYMIAPAAVLPRFPMNCRQRKMGLESVAVGRGKDKEPLAKKLGAHHYIDSGAGEAYERMHSGKVRFRVVLSMGV